jgi:hypothetical protein
VASFKEIDRVRKDPTAFRDIATLLLKFFRADLTDWETDFLQSVARSQWEELTTRQSEKLLQIRDDMQEVSEVLGFSVKLLLKGLVDARLDLSEDDEAWVVRSYERDPTSIKRKWRGRLLRCSRQLYLIDIDLDDAA